MALAGCLRLFSLLGLKTSDWVGTILASLGVALPLPNPRWSSGSADFGRDLRSPARFFVRLPWRLLPIVL